MIILSLMALIAIVLPLAYLYLLAVAAVPLHCTQPAQHPTHHFAVAIPAHNEESVISRTISNLRQMDYPTALFDVVVVADHCDDATAHVARSAGALVFERREGARDGKGGALRTLFQRVLNGPLNPGYVPYDAVVIIDADTLLARDFLRIMDARLSQGDRVIQGQHRIVNPDDGWFPALTWAMFLVDNRLQNLSRSNLGLSAKNMGDSICLRTEVLRQLGWGEGLTEDYAFRQRLLLEGIRICYEPNAMGCGEAPASWHIARAQRARWLRGTHDASQQYASQLLVEGLRRRDPAMFDGAIQAYLPSYSSLTLISVAALLVHLVVMAFGYTVPLVPWVVLVILLWVYPFWGLVLERAPLKAFLVILSGPLFIMWRTGLALTARFGRRSVNWIRTPRRSQ